MSDRKDEKLNNGDLREIKSLIGDADSGGFSLDDILAEFGGNPSARPGGIPVPSLPMTMAAGPFRSAW